MKVIKDKANDESFSGFVGELGSGGLCKKRTVG